ncbi:MAG: cytochrome c oxidase accessory protein CcoG [Hyphomicrobiaceae bacterium]
MATEPTVERIEAEAVNAKANRSLYAKRKKIHPKRARGWFRSLKWWIMAVTLGIYYLTPWVRWDRGPHAPDQAVLVDLANRRFYFFFIEIWPHEFFYVAGLLVMAGIGLFFITSTVGRAWCGYTCPQTVWVDLFLVVERYFEGDRNARIKLDAAPWTGSKIAKSLAKHFVWILIAIATGGAWIFYFADAPTLAGQFIRGEALHVAYATVAILTATTYVFGGLMREQVCTYMCPWPRIQAAMLDEHSLVVTYNDWRGEPRSRHAKKHARQGDIVGDCVDCNACVAVCPMGIDIRDGQQLECITCALCIDACDEVMEKIGRPDGLISYSTLETYDGNMSLAKGGDVDGTINPTRVHDGDGSMSDKLAHFHLRDLFRPRTIIYATIYTLIGLGLLTALLLRDRLDVNVLHERNPVFVRLSDGSIRNGYQLKILNMKTEPRRFEISISGLEGAKIRFGSRGDTRDTDSQVSVRANRLANIKTFVTLPSDKIKKQRMNFTFIIRELAGDEKASADAVFDSPEDAFQ